LAWPARFPPNVVVGLQTELGPYAYSGQYQQAPVPRKGGIFSLDYWQDYDVPERGPTRGKFPDMEFVLVSVDTSFTEKEENDPNGCTVWGIFRDQDDMPKVMLLWVNGMRPNYAIFARFATLGGLNHSASRRDTRRRRILASICLWKYLR
jgi:hypothetical protein